MNRALIIAEHFQGKLNPSTAKCVSCVQAIGEVEIDIAPDAGAPGSAPGLVVRAIVKVTGQTGVEMEALTAVSVACLTVYDMIKAVERGAVIDGIRLIEKRGGKSGHYKSGHPRAGGA